MNLVSATDQSVDIWWTSDTGDHLSEQVDLAAGVPYLTAVAVSVIDKQVSVAAFPAGSGGFAGAADPLAEATVIVACF